jgi:hypothetical protein
VAQSALTVAEAKETFIEGGYDLLLYLKKLLQQTLDEKYSADSLPEELVAAYNQLIILLNNSISGLRLPAAMIRSMLGDIRITLTDQKYSQQRDYQELIKQLEVATNLYISLANTQQELDIIAQEYKNQGHK